MTLLDNIEFLYENIMTTQDNEEFLYEISVNLNWALSLQQSCSVKNGAKLKIATTTGT